MVPDTLVRVSEMMDTPPIQNDYALFYLTSSIIWATLLPLHLLCPDNPGHK